MDNLEELFYIINNGVEELIDILNILYMSYDISSNTKHDINNKIAKIKSSAQLIEFILNEQLKAKEALK